MYEEKHSLDKFIWNEDAGVYVQPGHQHFSYSDGIEIENRILDILTKSKDNSLTSRSLASEITDWPTEYHFSQKRHSLLRHIRFQETDQILELGSGCGAITRQLGESDADVTALEGSLIRAKCSAMRCRDLPNVKVYCSDFSSVEFSKQFDIVTLIGVLEYSPLFFEDEDPFLSCLRLAKSALSPGGRLIVAIENQLGLKYFCGYFEEHVGLPFFGLEDLYTDQTPKTLGREALRESISMAGFKSIEFQYPFPGYKLPDFVFMENAFLRKDFAPGGIIRQLKPREYTKGFRPNIEESLLWPIIDDNGLIGQLANSFLIISRELEETSNTSNLANNEGLLAVGYTMDREPTYNTQTRFIEAYDKRIVVRKLPLRPELPLRNKSALVYIYQEENYVLGQPLAFEIMRKIRQDDFDGFLYLIRLWFDFVVTHGIRVLDCEDVGNSLMKPEFIDCIPQNMIISSNGVKYVDREWRFDDPYTLSTIVLRYLFSLDDHQRSFIEKYRKGNRNPVVIMCDELNIHLNESKMDEYFTVFDKINAAVFPWRFRVDSTKPSFKRIFFNDTEHNNDTFRLFARFKHIYSVLKRRLRRSFSYARKGIQILIFGEPTNGP